MMEKRVHKGTNIKHERRNSKESSITAKSVDIRQT